MSGLITIRQACAGDTSALTRLAALDSAPPLAGDVILAEVDGEARAAVGLMDGRTVADPFHPTLDLVALLQLRAAQLAQVERPVHPGGRRLRSHTPLAVRRPAVRAG